MGVCPDESPARAGHHTETMRVTHTHWGFQNFCEAECRMVLDAHRGAHGAVQREGGVLARLVHALLVQVADIDLDAAVVLRRDQLVGP